MVNHTFVNYIGNYDYYLEKREELTAAYAGDEEALSSESKAVTESKLSWQEQKEAQARERKRLNELKKTEERITSLEERNAKLDEMMTQEEVFTNSIRCQELANEKASLAAELDELYERWEELGT